MQAFAPTNHDLGRRKEKSQTFELITISPSLLFPLLTPNAALTIPAQLKIDEIHQLSYSPVSFLALKMFTVYIGILDINTTFQTVISTFA